MKPVEPTDPEIEEANEFTFAREAAAKFGAEHHEFRVDGTGFSEGDSADGRASR